MPKDAQASVMETNAQLKVPTACARVMQPFNLLLYFMVSFIDTAFKNCSLSMGFLFFRDYALVVISKVLFCCYSFCLTSTHKDFLVFISKCF